MLIKKKTFQEQREQLRKNKEIKENEEYKQVNDEVEKMKLTVDQRIAEQQLNLRAKYKKASNVQ